MGSQSAADTVRPSREGRGAVRGVPRQEEDQYPGDLRLPSCRIKHLPRLSGELQALPEVCPEGRGRKMKPWKNHGSNAYQRCHNPTNNRYARYGGRGIKYLLSADDMRTLWERDKAGSMRRPSIDRINPDGHYEISNCRFVEQAVNSGLRRAPAKRKRGMCPTCRREVAIVPGCGDAVEHKDKRNPRGPWPHCLGGRVVDPASAAQRLGEPCKVVGYGSCPVCPSWSLGIRADGRFVRHSPSLGSVEHSRSVKSGFFRTTVCPGSLTPAPASPSPSGGKK